MFSNDGIWAEAKHVEVHQDVSRATFETKIQPKQRPAVLRGAGLHWPLVQALKSADPTGVLGHFRQIQARKPVNVFRGEKEMGGRFSFNQSVSGFNFSRQQVAFESLLDALANPEEAHIYAGAIPIPEVMPDLLREISIELIPDEHERLVSLWLGTPAITAAHWDLAQNLACVLAGYRRFTLFPIQQVPNLYIGPLDRTLAGQPTSLVDFHAPDNDRFPGFKKALDDMQIADLEPGDILYMPSLWVHHVQSSGAVSAMVNIWWRDCQPHMVTPLITLFHAMLTLKDMPHTERMRWRDLFDHYIFKPDDTDPMAHLPETARGVLGPITGQTEAGIRTYVKRTL
ncbi:MAG: cupin-like domain-containing protein [Pseudomonadota bacterium]